MIQISELPQFVSQMHHVLLMNAIENGPQNLPLQNEKRQRNRNGRTKRNGKLVKNLKGANFLPLKCSVPKNIPNGMKRYIIRQMILKCRVFQSVILRVWKFRRPRGRSYLEIGMPRRNCMKFT